MENGIDAIHDFWFGELDQRGLCMQDRNALWFGYDADTDALCAERFGNLLAAALTRGLDHWADSDRGLVALVVLLDQLSRNIHRGTPAAFAGDARSLAAAVAAIDAGRHLALPTIHRVFLYLPLEHAEDLPLQERCVGLFEDLLRESPPGGEDEIAGYLRYAVAHRDVIARFGRFPHRNAILGRASSSEELDYLEHNSGF